MASLLYKNKDNNNNNNFISVFDISVQLKHDSHFSGLTKFPDFSSIVFVHLSSMF